jgi:hypothetical protein
MKERKNGKRIEYIFSCSALSKEKMFICPFRCLKTALLGGTDCTPLQLLSRCRMACIAFSTIYCSTAVCFCVSHILLSAWAVEIPVRL